MRRVRRVLHEALLTLLTILHFLCLGFYYYLFHLEHYYQNKIKIERKIKLKKYINRKPFFMEYIISGGGKNHIIFFFRILGSEKIWKNQNRKNWNEKCFLGYIISRGGKNVAMSGHNDLLRYHRKIIMQGLR